MEMQCPTITVHDSLQDNPWMVVYARALPRQTRHSETRFYLTAQPVQLK
jgi:hypothetical protein